MNSKTEQSTKIIRVAIPVPLHSLYDYLLPKTCQTQANELIGARVKVPFGKREAVGMIVEMPQQSNISLKKLKPIDELLDEQPLFNAELLKFLRWISHYYHHPLGDVISTALPVLLRQGQSAVAKSLPTVLPVVENFLHLNDDQQIAIDKIYASHGEFHTFLLHGVTGSGKTEVYLRVIANVLEKNQQALVLVPEISLTPQTVARFQERFSVPIAVIHSGLTDRARLDNWLAAHEGSAQIIIGTRSAIFSSLKNPGIIIVDEEHDLSFKQQEGLRYSARDVAIVRAQQLSIPIVLGSATPSLESFYNCQQQRFTLLELNQRAGNASQPQINLLDIRHQKLEGGLSPTLVKVMQKHLENKGQILLFLNRRGFAPVLLCHECGWSAVCHRCDAKLIYHHNPDFLQCHHCATTEKLIEVCPSCHQKQLIPVGLGTQKLTQALSKYFFDINIVRIDRDSTRRKGSLQSMLDDIHNGHAQILVGTQMLAKGHHFPDVTLVAIMDADSGLYSPDFRALEHTAQLLLQVAGRAGRAERAGEVIVQTHNPDHPLLQRLLKEGYSSFLNATLSERQHAVLPPFTHQVLIRAEAVHKNYPLQFLTEVKNAAQQLGAKQLMILGPIPALIERKAGRFRAQILLQSTQRATLHAVIEKLRFVIESLPSVRKVRWSLDIDPIELS